MNPITRSYTISLRSISILRSHLPLGLLCGRFLLLSVLTVHSTATRVHVTSGGGPSTAAAVATCWHTWVRILNAAAGATCGSRTSSGAPRFVGNPHNLCYMTHTHTHTTVMLQSPIRISSKLLRHYFIQLLQPNAWIPDKVGQDCPLARP
jgi:hypothetical protein